MSLLKRIFLGDENKAKIKKIQPIVDEINALEEEIRALSDSDFPIQTQTLKDRFKKGDSLDVLLPRAFALVREASRRTLGQRHFDVQLIGGVIIHRAGIAEMRTGEGKTLVATLAVYLNALTEKGVHVVTVNDYLARRDAVWMGQIYAFLGLSIGIISTRASYLYDINQKQEEVLDQTRDIEGSFHIVPDFLKAVERKEAYNADITYGTNSEFGFDYLRDNLEYDAKTLRARGYHFAIVDEIDSILIDEARTPLIISAPAEESESLYKTFADIALDLKEGVDYSMDEKHKTIALLDDGITKAEKVLGIDNIYTEKGVKYVHHLENAVRAKTHFIKDREYVVRDGAVIIVDPFTGRLQPGRRWNDGLHQAIEAKEGVHVERESRTYASITYQNFFRMYDRFGGMTGTALTSSEEFYKVYGLDVVAVPTNKKPERRDYNDQIFQTEKGKFDAVTQKVKELYEIGQPVLIGTVSIEQNELLSAYFKGAGIQHEVLNAKNHEREGEIIAQAGTKSRVTIATNMAGRGVDIKLGGNPGSTEEYEEVKRLGGLFVLGTERHEARRIDNQLRGRSGRQGDPGETQFFVSLEDSLMRVFASDTVKRMMGRLGIPEDQPIENRIITKSLESAQAKIEGFHFDSRKHVLQYDDVLNTQRSTIYSRRREILVATDDELETLLARKEHVKDTLHTLKEKLGDAYIDTVRRTILGAIDTVWLEHLENMEYLRSSVSLRAVGQRDPLVEYKKEGLILFKNLENNLEEDIQKRLQNILLNHDATPKESSIERVARTITLNSKNLQEKNALYNRNDKVTIKKDGETQTLKYKKAEEFLKEGWKIVGG